MRRLIVLVVLLVWPISGSAQEDKDWLTRTLQDALSSAGRQVTIDGFRGALSSRAEIDTLTISDGDGAWLILHDVALSWNRAALLSRRIEVSELSAGRVDVLRRPLPTDAAPAPEAPGFSLPELPVSVEIGRLSAGAVALAPPVLGQSVELSVDGSISLAGGEGRARLTLQRTDNGPTGRFELDASYANATGVLDLDLALDEGAGGIAATTIGLPGEPAVKLTMIGSGPLDAFTASIRLESDGAERLAGRVVLGSEPAATAGAAAVQTAKLDLSGDLAPLFAPTYSGFFGPDVSLRGFARRHPDGSTEVNALDLRTAALQVSGAASFDAAGLPRVFDLQLSLASASGPVVLPLSGPVTRIAAANLRATYDRDVSAGWSLQGRLSSLERDGLIMAAAEIDASGTIRPEDNAIEGKVAASAGGLLLADAALADALGPQVSLDAEFGWMADGPLVLPTLALRATGVEIDGRAEISAIASGGRVTGEIVATVPDLSRLSRLAGRQLGGGGRLNVNGSTDILGGAFDVELTASTTDLRTGWPQVDGLTAGAGSVAVSARRDETGIELRRLDVTSPALRVSASGRLVTGGGSLEFDAALDDAAHLVAGLRGRLTAAGTVEGADGTWTASATLAGPEDTRLEVDTTIGADGLPRIGFAGSTAAIGRLVPGLEGTVTAEGELASVKDGWAVAAELAGTAGASTTIAGTIAGDGQTADLALSGRLPLAIANRAIRPRAGAGQARFDLRLAGPVSLASLSGRAVAENARLSAPTLRTALTDVTATADISAGAATIEVNGKAASGGRISARGRTQITSPFEADLAVTLRRVGLGDARLYDTDVSGELRILGPLAGGASIAGDLQLGPTELRVPSTGFGASGIIPDIAHVAESAASRETRRKAGLLVAEARGSGRPYALDLGLDASRQVFLRGRGIDAELGGAMRLGGTTSEVIPSGQFDLIRGRLDILGRRFALQEGSMRLEGTFVPTIRLVAETRAEDTEISVLAEGPANAPAIRFVSRPELPEEEVLARLLFGRDLGEISPFQAAQLASAIATLSGRGGVGALERLRRRTGFDNLDITTGDTGQVGARVGKYLGENVYTEVTVGGGGETSIDLNLDLSPQVTVKGSLGADGSTGVGIFFQRDY